jgi:DNA repair protein SbcD/Mre11
MRLLHTSDWHLGRATYNASRAEDHDAVIGEIIACARDHKPDLIVHSGDLFDVVRPAYQEMARATSALQDLATVAPVVVLCGNHDSPALFDLFGQLLGPGSPIHFVSRARPPGHGGVLVFPTAAGEVIRLAPLPFVHANRMLDGFEEPGTWAALYTDRIHLVEHALSRGLFDGFDNRRDLAIFAAHLYVGGAVLSGSERRIQVGDSYATHLEHLPAVTYAAFGHIHKPQNLPGSLVNGCYAGSPIQLDFGEVGEAKRIVLVDARPGHPPEIQSLPLSGGRPLWRFEGTMDQLAEAAPDVGRVLALLTIHSPSTIADLPAKVQELLPDAIILDAYPVAADRQPGAVVATAPAGPEPGLEELFRSYLAEQGTRGAAADHVMATFSKLLAAIETEQEAVFPEEEAVPGAAPAATAASHPYGGPHAAATAADRPAAGVRTVTCRTCGATFDAPVRRGRPPSQCPACRPQPAATTA